MNGEPGRGSPGGVCQIFVEGMISVFVRKENDLSGKSLGQGLDRNRA